MKKKVLKPFDIEKAKNGAEVCTKEGNKARIICFDKKTEGDYTIIALVFTGKEEFILSYTADGKRVKNCDDSIDLMIVEYDEEEQHQFEPFQKVLVRDTDYGMWKCSLFSDYNKGKHFPFRCISSCYKQCVPFEGNEHLLGTNNSPE